MPLPIKLQEVVDAFTGMTRQQKIERLLAYAQSLPPFPDRLKTENGQSQEVPECTTPIQLVGERSADGGLVFYFDIPPESPTVRGLAALLANGLNGARPEEVLAVPYDFYLPMNLEEAVTQQHLNGFIGVLAHMKHTASQALNGP